MNSLWLPKTTTSVVWTLTMLCVVGTSNVWGQCPDGCGSPVVGSYPSSMMGYGGNASMLGDTFSAGDSFSGGPGGPISGGGGGGGMGYELGGTCCGPHWYDFAIQGVFILRDGGDSQGLVSRGIRGNADPNIVQSTSTPDFNFEAGFRAAGRFQTSATHSIEAIYLGGLDWDDRHVVTDQDHNLYSVFSDFGNDPFGGFEDSDQASISILSYDSELDSLEFNFRRALPALNERTHASLLWGFRYIRVDEALSHHIDVLPHFDDINQVNRAQEFTDYNLTVNNDMFGLQGGGETVVCLTPGIQFGAEGKLGVYGTNTDLNSTLTSTTLGNATPQSATEAGVSFVSDASLFALWQLHPMLKFRAGYEVLFISGIGTAGSNYDTAARSIATGNPLLTAGNVLEADSNDSVLYHGGHFGFEFGW